MNTNIKNRGTALITGGAKRIGRCIVLKLVELGYTVAIHYNRSSKEAQQLNKTILLQGGRSEIFSCDLLNEKNVKKLISKVIQKFPDLNLLINNASIFDRDSLVNCSVKNFKNHFAIHVQTPFWLSQNFAKICKKGHIINILDTNIVKNETQHFSYLLSKKTLAHLTEMSAVELAPIIRVNAFAPGFILPPVKIQNSNLQRFNKNIPLAKQGNTANITDSLEFLIKNDYLTGQILFNDGGAHLL